MLSRYSLSGKASHADRTPSKRASSTSMPAWITHQTRAKPIPLNGHLELLLCCVWDIENRAHYVRDVTLGEDASRIRTKPGIMARIRSVALNVLRGNGIQNISEALYANTVSFDQLLALGTQ